MVTDLVYDLIVFMLKNFLRLLRPEHRANSDSPVKFFHLLWLQKLQVRLENSGVGYIVVFQLILRKIAELFLGALWVQI